MGGGFKSRRPDWSDGFFEPISGSQLGSQWVSRAELSQLGGLRVQDAVHGRCALGERGPDLVTVNRLGHRRAAVPDKVADVLQADIVRAQDGHERMPQLAGRPCPAEPRGPCDLPELLPYVPAIQRRPVLTCQRSSGVPSSRQNTDRVPATSPPLRAVPRPGGCDRRGAPAPPWWAASGRAGSCGSWCRP
jgi:hypothetical protein